jgi:hypothetical protein
VIYGNLFTLYATSLLHIKLAGWQSGACFGCAGVYNPASCICANRVSTPARNYAGNQRRRFCQSCGYLFRFHFSDWRNHRDPAGHIAAIAFSGRKSGLRQGNPSLAGKVRISARTHSPALLCYTFSFILNSNCTRRTRSAHAFFQRICGLSGPRSHQEIDCRQDD